MKKRISIWIAVLLAVALLAVFAGPPLAREGVRAFFYPKPYQDVVLREAAEFDLDEDLVYAVMKAESGFDEDARSHADAQGLMQLTPQTFEWIGSLYPPENGGENILDPSDNVHCGCALLRLLLDQYGSVDVALCAYNAGMGNVSNWLSQEKYSSDGESLHTIPYPETDGYVKKVNRYRERYQKLYGAEDS